MRRTYTQFTEIVGVVGDAVISKTSTSAGAAAVVTD